MFRFTVRDLLWLTVVVALVVAWWLDHRRQDQRWEAHLHPRKDAALANSSRQGRFSCASG
jgi:hypothetical protein